MQNAKKLLLLLLVLLPSIFFLSKAFSGSTAQMENGILKITGAGAIEIILEDVQVAELQEELPETNGTGGFSLGIVKKGNFIRSSDSQQIRIIKNASTPFIHLKTEKQELYFNLENPDLTKALFLAIEMEIALRQGETVTS